VAKRPSDSDAAPPRDFPATTPRDLHPTSDIRFVIHELGKLTSQVERLIGDVKGHGEKIGEVKDAITFVKGAIWVVGGGAVIVSTIIGLILSGKISVTFH
jgi:hypothetical protein